ncbi:hypothetical protein Salat_2916700 [Sesamum alatum]|uniref:DUF7880 domain-containing protein n=1 Tax=Sesamum alatum TaxID=300844 RepID=A0AAE1XIQ5_9LAMI|nr:hypothetical protein Salat_2916700 [Sesamum alatum]
MTTTTATATAVVSFLPFSRASSLPVKPRRWTFSSGVRCTLSPGRTGESRRLISLSIVFLHFFSLSKDAMGIGALDKYVKKKKLDPLEAYIPAVILTELQIKELGRYLEVDQPKFADCRNLLRSGPAGSLRVNIRAVAQYASDAGNGKSAFNEVDQCLRALEELDSLLLRASRNDSGASIESMKANVATALNALNSVLQTVPEEVLKKGKAMANEYINPGNDLAPQDLDPELKKLEAIL